MIEKVYYCTKSVTKQKTLYGPFETVDAAQRAAYFHRPIEALTAASRNFDYRKGHTLRTYIRCGIEHYTDEEISYVSAVPHEHGYTSFTVKPVSACKVHPSWKKLFREYARSDRTEQQLADELYQTDAENAKYR